MAKKANVRNKPSVKKSSKHRKTRKYEETVKVCPSSPRTKAEEIIGYKREQRRIYQITTGKIPEKLQTRGEKRKAEAEKKKAAQIEARKFVQRLTEQQQKSAFMKSEPPEHDFCTKKCEVVAVIDEVNHKASIYHQYDDKGDAISGAVEARAKMGTLACKVKHMRLKAFNDQYGKNPDFDIVDINEFPRICKMGL